MPERCKKCGKQDDTTEGYFIGIESGNGQIFIEEWIILCPECRKRAVACIEECVKPCSSMEE